jgi:hypothetical protein
MNDISKFPRSQEAMKTLLLALKEDGFVSAGFVVCAVPIAGTSEVKETLVFTALLDGVTIDAGDESAPSTAMMALLEQAARGIKRRMRETGS